MKNTINQNIQILAHTQEKFKFINEEALSKEKELKKIEKLVHLKKEELKLIKETHEKKSLKNYNEKKRIDDINSNNLINYYNTSHNKIKEYNEQIAITIKKLSKYRGNNMKDVNMHKIKVKSLNEDFKNLIAFE